MANEEHIKILEQGTESWNQWRREKPDIRPNLVGEYLEWIELRGVNLAGANLTQAQLGESDLRRASLRGAWLHGADLSHADLSAADLTRASLNAVDCHWTKLDRASLRYADLTVANFVGTSLHGADLSKAKLGWTTFGDVDLSVVRGLDTAVHEAPSIIGIDTLYRSEGKISEVFLREAGVPDIVIEFAYLFLQTRELANFHTCFISHSSKDQAFCNRFHADLRASGIRSWYFPRDAAWGEPVWGEIDRSIKKYDKLVVVCSENSLQSGPVLREIERALIREDQERKHILFPIRIDDYLFEQWDHPRKADVISKVVGDFTNWNQDIDKYNMALQRLLRGLRADDLGS